MNAEVPNNRDSSSRDSLHSKEFFLPTFSFSEMKKAIDDLRQKEASGEVQTGNFANNKFDPNNLFSTERLNNEDCVLLWNLAHVPEDQWTDEHIKKYTEINDRLYEIVRNTDDEVLSVTLDLYLNYIANLVGVLDGKRQLRELIEKSKNTE